MLTDSENLASGISRGKQTYYQLSFFKESMAIFRADYCVMLSLPDFTFLHGLLDILPFVTDDLQARNALWSILARLLVQVVENDLSPSTLCHFASVFSQKSSLIEEDLAGHSMQNFEEIDSTNMSKTSDATVDAVSSPLMCF